MLIALTNAVSAKLVDLYPAVDHAAALQQHERYCEALQRHGAELRRLSVNAEHGDGCFIEDNAVVVDEVAILATMGGSHRRHEPRAVAPVLAEYRPVECVADDARIEGGDVLRVDRDIFVGRSARTNQRGIDELRRILEPLGYRVTGVDVADGLHLKTACTALDSSTLLANQGWLDMAPFQRFNVIDIHPDEPTAANVVRIGDAILMHTGYTRTLARVRERFPHAQTVDISEFAKADGGLTCLSLMFEVRP
jgi:dimethylargininase